MDWYYAESGKQYGPLTEDEFNQFVADGTIQSDTLVWRSGLDHWIKFGDYVETIEPEVEAEESDMRTCAECGNLFPESEMIPFKELWVCGSCKPLFIQKVREGAPLPGVFPRNACVNWSDVRWINCVRWRGTPIWRNWSRTEQALFATEKPRESIRRSDNAAGHPRASVCLP